MNASMMFQRSGRWLVGLVVAATIAAALTIPHWTTEKSNAVLQAPAVAGPVTDPGSGGG